MHRVESKGHWTLMCPLQNPGLSNMYGTDFDTLYKSYETHSKGNTTLPAEDLWKVIIETQIKTGGPSIVFKDAANGTSRNIIRNSSLSQVILHSKE